jgi:hypothetical protein
MKPGRPYRNRKLDTKGGKGTTYDQLGAFVNEVNTYATCGILSPAGTGTEHIMLKRTFRESTSADGANQHFNRLIIFALLKSIG